MKIGKDTKIDILGGLKHDKRRIIQKKSAAFY